MFPNLPQSNKSLIAFPGFPIPSKVVQAFPDFRSAIIRGAIIDEAVSYSAKSIILDIADNYGSSTAVQVRQVDFYYQSSKISNIFTTDFVSYQTTNYPNKKAQFAFDTSTSYIDGGISNAYGSATGAIGNQRIICVFNSLVTFDQIIINNGHATNTTGGGVTNRGAKNVKIYSSSDSITSTVFGAAISNSTALFDGVFNEHVALNQEDPQTLTLL